MHPRQWINKVESGGERSRSHLAEKIHHSDVSGGNNAKATKQHYKKHDDDNDEKGGTRFHGSECRRSEAAMSKAFVLARAMATAIWYRQSLEAAGVNALDYKLTATLERILPFSTSRSKATSPPWRTLIRAFWLRRESVTSDAISFAK
jgi:hypothetical protein